jgi:hypothetical protein
LPNLLFLWRTVPRPVSEQTGVGLRERSGIKNRGWRSSRQALDHTFSVPGSWLEKVSTWEAAVRELYADFNDFDEQGNLPLTNRGSVQSIAGLSEPLAEGEEVWLSDGDLRVKVRVFRCGDGSWEARSKEWHFEK